MEFADESKEKKDDRMKEEGRRKEESLANTRRERDTHTHIARGDRTKNEQQRAVVHPSL